MLRAGDLREVIRIDASQVTRGTSGGMQTTWLPFLEDVPANVVHVNGSEKQETSKGGQAAVSTKLFRIRFEAGLHEGMRIVYQDKFYNIQDIHNVKERDVVLAITATTGMNHG